MLNQKEMDSVADSKSYANTSMNMVHSSLADNLKLLSQSANQNMKTEPSQRALNPFPALTKEQLSQQSLMQALTNSQLLSTLTFGNLLHRLPKQLDQPSPSPLELYAQQLLCSQLTSGTLPLLSTLLPNFPSNMATLNAADSVVNDFSQIYPAPSAAKPQELKSSKKKRKSISKGEASTKRRKTSSSELQTAPAQEQDVVVEERGISKPKRKKGESGTENDKKRAFSSKYRGVYWNRECQAWRARLWHDKKSQHIGNFKSEIEAAKAFDKRAREVGRKELNFPRSSE